jgi:hypothetical protein
MLFFFCSEPVDIRNWFSSYQYESPEVPELDAVPGCNDGSETQDPLEVKFFSSVSTKIVIELFLSLHLVPSIFSYRLSCRGYAIIQNRLPGHSLLKHSSQDTALKEVGFGSRSEHGEVSATRDLLQIGISTVEQGMKKEAKPAGVVWRRFSGRPCRCYSN